MGKTYKKQSHRFDEEISSGRSGKHSKHANNWKPHGMRTLNSYVDEDDTDDYDIEDPWSDDVEVTDDIQIQLYNDNTKK